MSDPECGRIKCMLDAREMEHTQEAPTQMDTSRECHAYMEEVMQPKRSLFDKKGVGVYERVFFFIESKAVVTLTLTLTLNLTLTLMEGREAQSCRGQGGGGECKLP
jgi:hypothetical protein